jgi:hypothetical protein
LIVLPIRNESVGMSPSGPSRHFRRLRSLGAIGALKTWPNLLLALPGREGPTAAMGRANSPP